MDRHPIYVLFIECSSLLYDVCYEPDKTTIEFSNWAPVVALIESSFSFMVSLIKKRQKKKETNEEAKCIINLL